MFVWMRRRGYCKHCRAGLVVVSLSLFMVACESAPAPEQPPETPAVPVEPEAEPPLVRPTLDAEERYRRMIADWLYDGLRALQDDRLLTPSASSAHHYFSRVLALEPDNELAREGLQDIVNRYAQLAETASRQGQFENAELFLRRGERVNADHSVLDQGRAVLQTERERTYSVHTLDGRSVANRSDVAREQLLAIAKDLAESRDELFVLVTAPNDDQGRWMFTLIRDALDEPRLRGSIEIGSQPSVRLLRPPG